jgi:glycosyltransferase involved in cell wall biosynthesis
MKQGVTCTHLKVFDSRVKVIREAQPDVAYLHRENHVFVSACGAEGWGYPHQDAIAHGRPVICPGFGGPIEFLDNTCAWLLPVQMVQAPGHIYEHVGEIGRLNVDDLAYAMRYAYDNKQEVMEKATGAFVKARNFTLDQMTVSVKKAFNL